MDLNACYKSLVLIWYKNTVMMDGEISPNVGKKIQKKYLIIK